MAITKYPLSGSQTNFGSVSIRDFGAECDGVTDDSQAIQAAIDFATPRRLGVDLTAPKIASEFILASGLVISTRSRVFSSAGFGNCVCKVPDGANNDFLTTTGFSSATNSNNRNLAAKKFSLENFMVDCNQANQSVTVFNGTDSTVGTNQGTARGFGLKIYGLAYKIDKVHIYNAPSCGIYSECGTSPGFPNYALYTGAPDFDTESQISNSKFDGAGVCNIVWRGPNDGQWSNIVAATPTGIANVWVEDNANYGSYGVQWDNIHTYFTTSGASVATRGTYSTIYGSNIVVEGIPSSSKPAIRLGTNGNKLAGFASYVSSGLLAVEVLSNDNYITGQISGMTNGTAIKLGDSATSIQAQFNYIDILSSYMGNVIDYNSSDYNTVKGAMRAGGSQTFYIGTPGTNDYYDMRQMGGSGGVTDWVRRPNMPTSAPAQTGRQYYNSNILTKV